MIFPVHHRKVSPPTVSDFNLYCRHYGYMLSYNGRPRTFFVLPFIFTLRKLAQGHFDLRISLVILRFAVRAANEIISAQRRGDLQ